jgi:hypothetical protein
MLHTSLNKKTLLFVALLSICTGLHADLSNNINNLANNTSATPPSQQSNAGIFAVEAGSIAGAVQSCGQDVSVFSGRVGEAISKLSQNDADRVAAMILYQRALQQAQQTQINLHPLACSQVASDFMSLPIMKDDYEQTIISQLSPTTNPLAPQQTAAATVAQQPPTNQPWVNAAATVANNITAATTAPNSAATNSAPKLAQNYNDPNTGQTIPNSATPNMPEPPVNLPPENFPGETPNVGLPPGAMKQTDPNMAANSNAAATAMNQTNNQATQPAAAPAVANPYLPPPQANNTVQQSTPQSQQMVQGSNS